MITNGLKPHVSSYIKKIFQLLIFSRSTSVNKISTVTSTSSQLNLISQACSTRSWPIKITIMFVFYSQRYANMTDINHQPVRGEKRQPEMSVLLISHFTALFGRGGPGPRYFFFALVTFPFCCWGWHLIASPSALFEAEGMHSFRTPLHLPLPLSLFIRYIYICSRVEGVWASSLLVAFIQKISRPHLNRGDRWCIERYAAVMKCQKDRDSERRQSNVTDILQWNHICRGL